MTAPAPPPGDGRSSGAGCLRSCAIASGALVLLLLCGVAALYFVGRPYAAARLPEIRERSPLLGLALDYVGVEGFLGGQARPRPKVDPFGRQPGSNDRSAVPEYVVLLPRPSAGTYNVSPDSVTAYEEVALPVAEVAEHLLRGMEAQGWELTREEADERPWTLGWAREGESCLVELFAGEYATEVWLRCSLGG